jgi:hypothetical protein
MISNLTGKSTSVALDKGFTDALSSLDVTPGPFGSASISDGSASFPITGGNVTVYKPNEGPALRAGQDRAHGQRAHPHQG